MLMKKLVSTIEAGGKNGIMNVDEKTREYVRARTDKPFQEFQSDADAEYYSELVIKGSDIVPCVAKPHSPGAKVLENNKVSIDTFIVPATVEVEQQLVTEKINGKSLRQIFEDAGCQPIAPPSCAACLGGPIDTFGRTHGEEVVVSTTNRNFVGRMGSKDSQVYLASPYTTAASAITGVITDPRKYV